ncbi:MAG: LysM peptidoglycan-binding domain-containing protein [Planctomycetia bacterium]|nr:LysM peptidoglycan-binding domain-containing protein [Planctomycetia bacterium]
MSHETKIGVLVSCSFVCMVGAVIYLRMYDPAALGPPTAEADLPGWAQPSAPAAAENVSPKTETPSAPVAVGHQPQPNPIPSEIQRTTHVVPGAPAESRPPFNPPTASVPNPLLGGGERTPPPAVPPHSPLVHETPAPHAAPEPVGGGMPPAPVVEAPAHAAPVIPPPVNVVEPPAPVETPHFADPAPPVAPPPAAPVETPPAPAAPVIPPPPPAHEEPLPPIAPPPAAPMEPVAPPPAHMEAPLAHPTVPTEPAPSAPPLGGTAPAPIAPPPEPAPAAVPPVNPIPSNPIPSNPIPSNPIPSNPVGSVPGVDPVPPRGVILGTPETPSPRPGVMPEARHLTPPAGDTMPEARNQVAQNLPPVNYPLPPVATQARPALPGAPEVISFNEETHVCKPGDTFATIAKEKYYSEKYDRALLMFNRAHPMAADGIRNEPPMLRPGAEVYIPPMNILERNYAALIPGLVPVQQPGTGQPAVVGPLGGTPTGAPGFAPSASRSSPGADRLYRVTDRPETLWEVAARTLGNGERWSDIYRLNPGLNSQGSLPVGTVLRLPPS